MYQSRRQVFFVVYMATKPATIVALQVGMILFEMRAVDSIHVRSISRMSRAHSLVQTEEFMSPRRTKNQVQIPKS
jgi:hypothetical protein